MADEFGGRLRERVMLERAGDARDDSGNLTAAWEPRGTLWIGLIPADTPTTITGESRVSRPRYRAMLRARGDIDLRHRLRWRGKTLRILRVEPDPRTPDQLTLLVEEHS
jgi:head-tail adaptor